jgi:hypothetical protein
MIVRVQSIVVACVYVQAESYAKIIDAVIESKESLDQPASEASPSIMPRLALLCSSHPPRHVPSCTLNE